MSRTLRSTLLAMVLILAMVLAACQAPAAPQAPAEGQQPPAEEQQPPAEEAQPAEQGGENVLEIFSWWTNPGEADGLAALFSIYNERYPGVEIINATVAGGAGTDAKAVLKTRMLGGDPPDSFQVHGGQELIANWVVTGYMEPITFIYEEEGWMDKFPQQLLDMVSYEGEIYSVPVNVHRSNVLWYNVAIFEENGLEPPKTFDEFFQVAEALQAAGITPLALGGKDRFEVAHLYEDVLLGALGPDGYRGLWDGSVAWTSDEVRAATEIFSRMLDYTNSDYSAVSWAEAAGMVAEGKAAMNIMGDWAAGYFINTGHTPGEDIGFLPSPNSEGSFMVVTDTFGLPKGAPHRENAVNWLRVVGSKEGQEAFNPKKGSICARLDCDPNVFGVYLQSSMQDFASNALTPSVVHGSAAPDAFSATVLLDATLNFVVDRDIDLLLETLQQAAEETYLSQ